MNQQAQTVPASTGDTLVEVRGVHKEFKRGNEVLHVLKGVDLDIRRGEFLALMGPSGSGKSTLLNLLGALDRVTSGKIVIDGHHLDQMSDGALAKWRANHVGFVFQLYHLLPVLTAAGNVELPLLLTGLGRAERKRRVQAALALVGLQDRTDHKPAQLSGGQEQRVGIARAIVTDPDLLLCDEPTGDLDRKAGDAVLDLLGTLNKENNKTIIMVTHDPHAAARADRVLHMNDGLLSSEAVE
ncbi:MAG: ABC transporter ATP-binding protein [Gammaproteobacteria bacterium]|nr:ABC transporter ATP-binding protein [Gammaproteobacteria bacterium]